MIVCGWYTPDYASWAKGLIASLEERDLEHDIVAVEPMDGRWERKTLAKPKYILAAMDRHPDKVIVYVDVDCVVVGDLKKAVADIRADVAVLMTARMRRFGSNPPYRFRVSSGTIILQPTKEARKFIQAWQRSNEQLGFGDVDQTSFMLAMADESHAATFQNVTYRLCTTQEVQVSDPIIKHARGSADHRQLSHLERRLGALVGFK
jgi:hypothetical protein